MIGPFKTQAAPSYTYHPQKFRTLESFNHDGIEVARRRVARREWPLRQVLYFLVAVISFKIFLFFEMGGAAYGAKVAEFQAGTTFEQIAATVMALDPVSLWVIDAVRYGLF